MSMYEGANHAKLYKTYRPVYTKEIYDTIFQYCTENGGRFHLAVDVACGSGQGTLPLLTRFEQVIGVDISEEQLKHAPTDVPNLMFRQSQAESLPFLESGSVDLVTAATGVHWFNIPAFFREMERVLTPGGCLAVYGYGTPSLQDHQADEMLKNFRDVMLEDFNVDKIKMLNSGYSSLQLPFPGYKRFHVDCIQDWRVDHLCGYIASTARWQERLKLKPDCDSLDRLANEKVT